MVKPRVAETEDGIQGEFNVRSYDAMQRRMRDRGWLETDAVIKSGITEGHALELGPGPGYVGLEWLKKTAGTTLTGVDISPDMVALARENAAAYGFADRTEYVVSSGNDIPFDSGTFDAAFTTGSMHEWAEAEATFEELWRVLRPGGRLFISDLRRDMNRLIRWFISINAKPDVMRQGFNTSVNASYTPKELRELIAGTSLRGCVVTGNPVGLRLAGVKP
ncbi:MAG: methyltransferase domain-containing protein [Candidatus Zixiibacteriota bacterium]|jgi:ubiquinone/menaquinone biosynthesis C-methylase UbiE